MKIAKRTLAILMAMVMAVSTLALAASAGDLQAQIDAAANGATIKVYEENAVESLVISKKTITLDLQGNCLNSEPGSPAITVKDGATVTIINGHVESRYLNYSGEEEFFDVADDLLQTVPSAIQVEGANSKVILNGVRAVGGFFRVPRNTYEVPTGSALKLIGGAQAELNGAALVGSYALTGTSGTVEINDAILVGYIDAVKSPIVVNYDEDTVEKVNAADRIDGYLTAGAPVEQWEKDMVKDLMDTRILIYTVKPTDENALLTIDENDGTAIVEAAEINHLYAASDCSYKYVPKYAYVVGAENQHIALGQKFAADTLGGDAIVRVEYQLEFAIAGDLEKYVKNFYDYVDYAYDLAIDAADDGYVELLNKYDSIINQLVDVYLQIERTGAEVIPMTNGMTVSKYLGDTYYAVIRDVIALAGVKVFNAAKDRDHLTHMNTSIFSELSDVYARGTAEIPPYETAPAEFEDQPYLWVTSIGTLDKIDALIEQFKALKGEASFGDQTKWADYALFVVDNYRYLLNTLLPEALERLGKLKTTLSSGDIGQAINELGDQFKEMKDAEKSINDAYSSLYGVDEEVQKFLNTPYIKDMLNQLDENRAEVAPNMERLIDVYNHKEDYINPNAFIDGDFVKAYYMDGPVQVNVIEKEEPEGNLSLYITGSGTITVDGEAESEAYKVVPNDGNVTLVATAAANYEFLYWKNYESGRIITTNATLNLTTNLSRSIEAVFAKTANSVLVLTTSSGTVIKTVEKSANDASASFAIPAEANTKTKLVGFEFKGWGASGDKETLDVSNASKEYANGSSAFDAVGTLYSEAGFTFFINSGATNKYLATSKFEVPSSPLYTVMFNDNGKLAGSKKVKYANTLTYTAKYDNFAYWTKNNKVVSLNPRYAYTCVGENATLVAKYGAPYEGAGVIEITKKVEDTDYVTFYIERSAAAGKKILSSGLIYSLSEEYDPSVENLDGENVKSVVSTVTTNDGLHCVSLDKQAEIIEQGTGYISARAFLEIEGEEIIYGDVVHTAEY